MSSVSARPALLQIPPEGTVTLRVRYEAVGQVLKACNGGSWEGIEARIYAFDRAFRWIERESPACAERFVTLLAASLRYVDRAADLPSLLEEGVALARVIGKTAI